MSRINCRNISQDCTEYNVVGAAIAFTINSLVQSILNSQQKIQKFAIKKKKKIHNLQSNPPKPYLIKFINHINFNTLKQC